MNTLSNIDNYYIPNTLDGINTIQENINDNALLVDGTNFMLADLNVGGFNIKNLDAGIANNEAVNVGQLNLKLNKAGDTMTGALNMNTTNKIINLATPTLANDAANKNYVDTHTTGNYVLKSGDTMTGALTIDKNATVFTNFNVTSSQTIEIKSGNPLFELYTLTYNGLGTTFRLPYNTQSDLTLQNKTIAFKITGGTEVFLTSLLLANAFTTIIVDGVSYVSTSLTKSSSFILKGTGTIGIYTTHTFQDYFNTDQLTLRSSLGTDANTEFSGIRFRASAADAGFIRTQTDRPKQNSIMSFQVRQSNVIVKVMEIGTNILTFEPIIRSAWSSGELIQTKIFSRATTGVSQVLDVAPNTTVDWIFPTITMNNTPNNSIIVMTFDAPYHYLNFGTDALEMIVYDDTGITSNIVFRKTQYYNGNAGGGTRSSPIFPFSFSHTPSQATSTIARTYRISITNRSANDTLYLCQGSINNVITDMDYYTCEMKEIKI